MHSHVCLEGKEISLPWNALQPWKMENLSLLWRGAPIKKKKKKIGTNFSIMSWKLLDP